jgi:hypothetical protein
MSEAVPRFAAARIEGDGRTKLLGCLSMLTIALERDSKIAECNGIRQFHCVRLSVLGFGLVMAFRLIGHTFQRA